MNTTSASIRQWCAALALASALAAIATADVTLTASSPAGSTVILPGGTFVVNLAWSGTPAIAAADYAVTLNTSQILLTNRVFNPSLSPYADAPYLAALPTGTTRIDATWFKEGGFTGNDMTLHFQVPANYTGPATLNIGLVVDGVQDGAATPIPFTVAGTTVNLQPIGPLTGTNTTTDTVATAAAWSALTWTGSTPNGNGDIANFSFAADRNITLDVPVTLGRLNCTGTGQYNLLRSGTNAMTFDNSNMNAVASVLMTRAPSLNATGRRIDSNVILNSDLIATWGRMQGGTGRTHGFRGLVSGTGRLSLNYAIAPTEGPDTGTSIYLDGTTATAAHQIHLGLAGDAANTYTGGTDLRAGNSVFGTVKFMANKTNALGSPGTAGRLFMHQAALDMMTFNQTVGGLSGGTGSSKISSTSSTAGTTTLTIAFDSDKGPFSFSGVIMNGADTGVSAAVRTVALTKSGSGIQTLTADQTYTGPTLVSDGTLLVNGSLAAGSTVTVDANGMLGGTGTVSGTTSNHGTIAPGASVGSFNLGATTMEQNSRLTIEFSDWNGTAGTAWDLLNCASLALAATPDERLVITLLPTSLANFTEATKAFTIANSATAITGFNANAITIYASAMPGTGTWAPQLDATGKLLQLVYTAGSSQTAYSNWQSTHFSPQQIANGLAAPDANPDQDGSNNLAEFAFNGNPLSGSSTGLFVTEHKDTGTDGQQELVFTCAVRRGAVFTANGSNAQVSALIDGVIYTVEGSDDLTAPWDSAVSTVGNASNTPPAGSGLPTLTTDWEYRTFSGFNGLPGKGFIRAKVSGTP